MHHNRFRSAALVMACAILGGCAGMSGVTSVSPSQPDVNDLGQYRSAARDGVVRTIIVGNPLGSDDEQLVLNVNQMLGEIHTNVPVEFRTTNKPDDVNDPRIVIVFSPKDTFKLSALCGDEEQLSGQTHHVDDDRISAVAAFCVGENDRLWTKVQAPIPASLDDSLFRDFVHRIAFDVIPAVRIRSDGKCLAPDCA